MGADLGCPPRLSRVPLVLPSFLLLWLLRHHQVPAQRRGGGGAEISNPEKEPPHRGLRPRAPERERVRGSAPRTFTRSPGLSKE